MIRLGRDADASGFKALIAACWGEYPGVVCDFDAEMPEIAALATHMRGRGGELWAAEHEGGVVGMVAAYPAEDGWHLSRMYVAASHRGTGLAAALIACAETHARGAGAAQMVLWTDMLFVRAHAFYEKCGYVRRGGLRALDDLSRSIEARYWKPLTGCVVEALDVAAADSAQRALAVLLERCAEAGAPTPFLAPVSPAVAREYWRGVAHSVGKNETCLLLAWRDGAIAGSLQLEWEAAETARHRATLRMVLVAPGDRCQGVARALQAAAKSRAEQAGRTLLMLEAPGDEHSSRVFQRFGWVELGTVPGYWRGPASSASLYYMELDPSSPAGGSQRWRIGTE